MGYPGLAPGALTIMRPSLEFLPEPHTEFRLRLAIDSPHEAIAWAAVVAAIALGVWWLVVKRRR